MGRVFVSGSTGFIGKVVVEKLLARGESVIGFSKTLGNDLMNYRDVEYSMKSCDRVIHCAAFVSFKTEDSQEVAQINFVGTGNIMKAALVNKVKKMVFVSSAITRGISVKKDFFLSETCEVDTNNLRDAYTCSKIMAERLIVAGPVPASIVSPTTVNIPMLIENFGNKKMLIVPPGGTNIIDVRDVAEGIIAALDRGQDKEGYILSNVNITYKDLAEKITGGHAFVLPRWSLRTAKYLARYVKDKYTSPFTITNSYFYKYYSNIKARHEIGWEPKITLEEMIRR
ncbi:MAG: NAD-dependent epimerase/dehydratase family protein [Candidatus Omnitrophota bacterium]